MESSLRPSFHKAMQFFGENMPIELKYTHMCCLRCCSFMEPLDYFNQNVPKVTLIKKSKINFTII